MAMNSFTVRGRETGREEAILQQSTISDCGQTTNGWKVLEKKKGLPPSHFSSRCRLLKCPPSNTYTHKWHHNSISAINLGYEDASIFSNVNGRVRRGWQRGWGWGEDGVNRRVRDCRADLGAL